MGKQSEKGNVIELVIIGVLLLGIIGLVVWRVVDSNKQKDAATTTSTMTSQSTNQTTNDQSSSAASTSTQQTSDPNKGYLVIDNWGVRFKPSSSEQIQYQKWNNGGDAYSFTTATASKVAGCADSLLWLVDRHTTNSEVANGQILNNGNKIGDYYYYYYHTQEMCAQNSADQATIEQQIKIAQDFIQTIQAKQ